MLIAGYKLLLDPVVARIQIKRSYTEQTNMKGNGDNAEGLTIPISFLGQNLSTILEMYATPLIYSSA